MGRVRRFTSSSRRFSARRSRRRGCPVLPAPPAMNGSTSSRASSSTRAASAARETWRSFTGERAGFADILDAAKRTVVDTMLASEFTVLVACARAHRRRAFFHARFHHRPPARRLAALCARVSGLSHLCHAAGASAHDRATIAAAIARARARWPGPDPEIFDFLLDAITVDLAGNPSYSAPRVRNFALKLQQFTGPLMAKAMEDTAFYRYHRLLALNEVGGDPAAGALRWPSSMRAKCAAPPRCRAASPRQQHTTPSAATTHARASWRCPSWRRNGKTQ